MSAFYNEIEAYPVRWLRNLIDADCIASGAVDDRSITEVTPDELRPHAQAHFFAGIGVWSHALRLAGWPDDRPVWTGSCPCQPFSVAGRGLGIGDPRHLWPVWFGLIRQCRPPVVFGEQVASPDGLAWLDAVHADLEGAGYAFGAADLCAAGVGAPHIRQRLYFVGIRLADADATRRVEFGGGGLGHADSEHAGRDAGAGDREEGGSRLWSGGDEPRPSGATSGFWAGPDWVPCRDGKLRPVEPGSFPLAHGAPARVGRLRAYGNAIVSEVAATFIRAVMEAA